MLMTVDLKAQAVRLRELHHAEEMLLLPNVWDAASAEVVAEAGFPAIATTSAAIADMLGYPDGEGAPWPEMLAAAGRIARAVAVPVTVDAEAGYGLPPGELVDRLLEIGVVGCNLEDTDHRAGGLVDAGSHAEYLAAVRAAADDAGIPVVINARVDTYLPGTVSAADRLTEAVRRGRRYVEAGADCVYPIGVGDERHIATLVADVPGPINANTRPGPLDLAKLRALGVARVSYGPRFYRRALADLKVAVGQELLA
jgi:2-methylisocitrate lyase-like PEP mutase family enzyme